MASDTGAPTVQLTKSTCLRIESFDMVVVNEINNPCYVESQLCKCLSRPNGLHDYKT